MERPLLGGSHLKVDMAWRPRIEMIRARRYFRCKSQSKRAPTTCQHSLANARFRAMNFEAFKNAISSPAIRQVAIHWNEARGSGLMPAWSDIRPAALAPQLPIIWSYQFDRDRGGFTARLAGDRIEQIFGKSFRKLRLADAHSEGSFTWAYAMLERVVMEPAIHRSSGRVFKHLGRSGYGERIVMPLSGDGVLSDGILGATEYHYSRSAAGTSIEIRDTSEAWYSLRPVRQRSPKKGDPA